QALALIPEPLKFTDEHSKTTIEIVNSLQRYHFRNQAVDDELSEKFLDSYLKNLDPGKSHFLQSDIAEFTKQKHKFDDHFKAGDLTISFQIFDRFRERFINRLTTVIAQLEDDEISYDFDTEESLPINYDDLDWPTNAAAADELWRKRI